MKNPSSILTERPCSLCTYLLPRVLAAVLAMLWFLPAPLLAQPAFPTWQGTGTNWTTAANWDEAFAYGQLEWTGGGNATSWNDNSTNPLSMWRFYFNGSTAYTLGGNAVSFFDFGGTNGGILSDSSVTQTINMNVNFADTGNSRPMFVLTRGSGGLTFGGTVNVAGTVTALGIGGLDTNGIITFNGPITGSAPVVIGTNSMDGNNTGMSATRVVFAGSNTYTGGTLINAGSLQIGNGSTNGSLSTSSTITNNGTLIFNRSDNIAQGTNFSGSAITGTGGMTKLGAGTLTLSAANTYSGGTIVGAGTLRIGTNYGTNVSGGLVTGALGTGNLTLSNGVTITAVGSTTRTNVTPVTTLKGDITVGAASGDTGILRMASLWDLDAGTRTITLARSSSSYASGQEIIGFITNSALTSVVFSNGNLVLATTAGTTNNPSVARFNTASFVNNAGLTVNDGVAIISGNGTFFSTGTNAPALTLATDTNRGGGILQMGDGTSGGNAVVRATTVYSLSGGGTVSSANTTGTAATGTLTINNGNNAVFSGRITETGGTGIIAVTKSGSGTQTLGGTNNYSGLTTVSAGALRIANASALGATNGTTTVSSGATLELSNGITVSDEGLSLNGTGVGSLGALRSVSGNNSYLGLITQAGNSYYGADSGATLTISNVSGGTTELWIVGDGNTTIAGSATNTGATAFVKTNTGTAILMASNNWGGAEYIRRGTVILSNNNALGVGGTTTLGQNSTADNATLQIGQNIVNSNALNIEFGTGTKTVSYQDSTGTGTQLGGITLNNSSLAFNIATGGSLLFGGGVTSATGGTDVNRLAIDGGGTLIVTNNGTGIATTDRYQVRVGNGTLVIGSGTIVARTNTSGLGHGIDLGVDLNGTAVSATSSLRASNSVTISNAIFVSTTGGNARVLGASGANAAVSFSGPIGLSDAALTLDATNGQNVAVSGAITNFTGTGSLIKTGTGTATLSGNNTFTGKTTVSGGTLSINADARLGTAPGSFVADQLTLSNGGKLLTTAGFTMNTNRGITLGAGGGGIEVASGQNTSVGTGQLIAGSGSLTKTGAGTLTLQAASTYSGGTVLSEGFIQLRASSVLTGSNITSGALGVGNITINGGGILGGGGQTLNATNITISGDFAVNSAATTALNGRVSLGANLIDLAGATRTISQGRVGTAAFVLTGGQESLRFITNATYYTSSITNGTMRFVRDAGGTSADFASVNFSIGAGNGIQFLGGSGFTVGTNIITTFGSGSAFVNANGVLPHVATEDGGIFNLGTTNGVNSQTIRSLSGSAGYVTTLATLASTNTATLTISNQAGDNYNYGGQIVTGSSLNTTLVTTATNAAIAITKRGQGTQVLSGVNTYGGATAIAEGVMTFANTSAKSVNSQVTVSSNAVIGLGVGGAGGYDAATITSIISNSATGYTMNIGSIVGIDTTAGNFDYGTGIGNSRELWKLGANTLTLSAGSGRTGATVVAGGTLDLNAASGQAAGSTTAISVSSGAKLLISKSDQVSDTAAITLSGGTIQRASGVSEVFGALAVNSTSTLDFGTGAAGTITFGTYTPSSLLTVQNFLPGNVLKFGSDLTSTINNSSLFSFSGAFTSEWNGSNTFTITAIPEPTTVLAAIGLTGLFLWPMRRRLMCRGKGAGSH